MASTGTPLGIGLAIDFQKLDSDLSRVADRIDKVGSETTLKVGTLSGLMDKGGINTDQLSAQVATIGTSLSRGMATGVGTTNALLLGMASRINATLERLAGVVISLFTRIDAAMRFPRFDSAISSMHVKLANVWKGQNKDLSQLDIALAGGMGKTAQKITKIFRDLFANLGKSISEPIEKAIGGIVPAIEDMANRMVAAMEAAARSMARSMDKAFETMKVGMKGMTVNAQAAGEANAKAFLFGEDAARKRPRKSFVTDPNDLATLQKGAKVIDLGEKIKPPSKTALKQFFVEIKKGLGELSVDAYKDLFAGMKSEPAKPRPRPQTEFKGRVAEPQLGKGFLEVGKQSLQAITAGIATARQKFAEFSKEGYTIDQILTRIARSFGGWGVAIAVPLAGFVTLGSAVVRTTAFFLDMGAVAVRGFNRIHNLLTSIGGIGNKTFTDLYQSHGVFMGSVLSGVKVLTMLARGLWDIVSLKAFRRVGDDATHAKGAVGALTGSVGKLLGSVGRLGVEMMAAFGVVGVVYKVVEFFKSGVKGATELNATVAQSKATFGESFGAVAEQAEKNAKAFHTSKGAQLELASAFGGMAQGAGIAEDKSAALANRLTQLAVDAGGVGIGMSEIGEAMKTGLSGRAISLKQFAVNIDENTTKAYAWKTGIAKVGEELTMQQTLMARAGQVMRGLDYVSGSLTKGVNQAGVQFKMAGGGLSLFAEKMGEMLLPGLKAAAVGFNELMSGALDLVGSSGPAITAWAEQGAQNVQDFIAAVKGFGPEVVANITWAWGEAKKGPLGFVIDGTEAVYRFVKVIPEAIGIAIRNAGTLWEIAKLEVGAFVENSIRRVQTFGQNFGVIFDWLKRNWFNMLKDMGSMIATFFKNLMKNAGDIGEVLIRKMMGEDVNFKFTGLLDGFKATTEKLPQLIEASLVDVGDEVKKLYDKIGQNELKRPKFKGEGEGPAGMKQKPLLPEDKSKEYKLGGALEQGSKEAFSAISRGVAGKNTTTDAVKQGVAVQREHLGVAKQQLAATQNSAKMPAIAVK